jgi:hypothetical protein
VVGLWVYVTAAGVAEYHFIAASVYVPLTPLYCDVELWALLCRVRLR